MTLSERQQHILIVDDEDAVRALLRGCFEPEGFRISEARDSGGLEAVLTQDPVDLITLDINLGRENGFDIARKVRSRFDVPIVMITGKGEMIDRVVGLELGADDYITKPFHIREVQARIRAVLRRYRTVPAGPSPDTPGAPPNAAGQVQASGAFAFDGWVLDTARRELRSTAGDVRELTTAEFDLLKIFVERPSRVLSRDVIMDLLKGHDWSPFDRSIDSLVVRLRKKIEPEPDAPRLVKTVRGVGYVFAAEVRPASSS